MDLTHGWIDFPRPKTGIPRRCPLWPETVAAIRDALASRPAPRIDKYSGLVFLTPKGNPWRICERADRENGDVSLRLSDFIGKKFSRLLKDLKVHRPGVGFYALRHTFRDRGRRHPGTKWPSTPSWAMPAMIWHPSTANGSTTPGSWPSPNTSGSGFSEIRNRSRLRISGFAG